MLSPEIATPRLRLRRYARDDEAWNVRLLGDPEVMRHVGGGVRTPEQARELFGRIFSKVYAEDLFDLWAVADRATGAPVGHAELKPRHDEEVRSGDLELVYMLLPEAWGRGYATELVRALVERARARGAPRAIATIAPSNAGSIRVVEKAGFALIDRYDDEDGTTLVYALPLAPQH